MPITLLISITILAFLFIIFEEITHISKAKTSMLLGGIAWIILYISAKDTELITVSFNENLLEIASLWIFLISTMTFVAYLNSKGLMQMLIQKLYPPSITIRALMIRIALFALFLSAICDNVTATLVSIALLSTFELEAKIKCKIAVLIVFAVNSGGVSLITGDVTTLMIFLDKHVTIPQLVYLFIPASISTLFLAVILSFNHSEVITLHKRVYNPKKIEKIIFVLFFTTVILTMVLNILFQIPPVLTFLTGLGIMFLIGNFEDKNSDSTTKKVMEYIREIEYETLFFFLGVLLLVGMLKEIGVLDLVTEEYKMFNPYIANFFAGLASAVVDNVPLTAALLKAEPSLDQTQWLCLTYAVGVGGSLLVIGSASGIIMMSKIKELSFFYYCKFTPAILLAYSLGYFITMKIN